MSTTSELPPEVVTAIEEGNLPKLKKLAAKDAQLIESFGLEMAKNASGSGQLEILKWLAKEDVNFVDRGKCGTECACNAAFDGHLQTLMWLVEQGVDPTVSVDSYWGNCAHRAAAGGHLDILQWLDAYGVDINQRSEVGTTCLMWAARSGNLEVLEWLFEKHPDIAAIDCFGMNAAHHAVADEVHIEALKLLADRGAELRAVTEEGDTCIHYILVDSSIDLNSKIRILGFLAEHGIDLAAPDSEGGTLQLAIKPRDNSQDPVEIINVSSDKWSFADCKTRGDISQELYWYADRLTEHNNKPRVIFEDASGKREMAVLEFTTEFQEPEDMTGSVRTL